MLQQRNNAGPKADGEKIASALGRLYTHLSRRRRVQLVLVFGLMLVGAVAELVTLGAVLPFLALIGDPDRAATLPLLGKLVTALAWQSKDLLVPAATLFAVVALAAGAIRLLLAWASQKFVFRLGHDIGVDVYRRTLYQPYAHHLARNSSATIADINKVQSVVGGVMMPLMQGLSALVITIFILAGLLLINPFVALVAAGGFGGLYLTISVLSRRLLNHNSHVIAAAQGELIKTIQEGLGGIRDVLLDQAQLVYIKKFSAVDTAFRDAQIANAFIAAAPRYVIEASGMALIAGLAVLMARGDGGIATALPVLGALALGAVRMLPLLQLIYNAWSQIAGNVHNILDVLHVLDQPMPKAALLGRASTTPLPFMSQISLEKLGFSYEGDGKKVFEQLDLTISRGSRVGIVGKTGSGKSTLIDIIMGLLQPSEGTVRIDGEALNIANVARWQARIAHVPQAIYLSDGTIAENIAFGVPALEIDFARLRRAADQAAIAVFIGTLPKGFDTIVGERGVRLSGGQRQRLGIARALYRQADVLIFDEATSALDNETEAAVMHSIDNLSPDLTVLIVAHRLSTLKTCSHIIEMGKTACVER